jgi:hypothetical protein
MPGIKNFSFLGPVGVMLSSCSNPDTTAADDGDGTRQRRSRGHAFPPDRPDQPLCISVSPRRPRGRGSIADTHGTNTSDEYLAIGSIAVTDEIAWSFIPSPGLSELPGNPLHGWMRRGSQPQEPASLVLQDQKIIEKLSAWLRRNVRQPCDGGPLPRATYLPLSCCITAPARRCGEDGRS